MENAFYAIRCNLTLKWASAGPTHDSRDRGCGVSESHAALRYPRNVIVGDHHDLRTSLGGYTTETDCLTSFFSLLHAFRNLAAVSKFMPDPRAVVALILILFIIFSPDPQGPVTQVGRSYFDEALEAEEHSLNVLNTSHYGDFSPSNNLWLNVSGFRNDTLFSWNALGDVKDRATKLSAHALGDDNAKRIEGEDLGTSIPLYQNVTGVIHGNWIRSPLSLAIPVPQLNMTEYSPIGPFGVMPLQWFDRNITEDETRGSLRIRLGETDSRDTLGNRVDAEGVETSTIRTISAGFEVQFENAGLSAWEARMHGVHFLDSGNIILTTTSEKFAGLFMLPHLALSQFQFDHSQILLNRTIRRGLDRQEEGSLQTSNPWSSAPDGSADNPFGTPACELIVYLQQRPETLIGRSTSRTESNVLKFMENELRFPTGAFIPRAQDMQFSMLAYSPDCGYALESKGPPEFPPQQGNHLVGPKLEVEYRQGRHHLLSFAAVLGGQLWLLTNQMREASTPSTRSRISFYTIAMLSLGDGFTTMTMALVSLFIPDLWVLIMATCFLAFLSVSFFGMRFLMDIWNVQAPERERSERERRAGAGAGLPVTAPSAVDTTRAQQLPIITPAGADTLPLPATARRPVDTGATPLIVPSDGDGPIDQAGNTAETAGRAAPPSRTAGFGALYTRFYLLLLALLFLSLNAASWPSAFRRAYFTILALFYLSFWIPQIRRNAIRNCRRALRWDFVVGQSILRLAPFAYFYGYRSNALFANVDLYDLALLVGWVWMQCVVLISQEIIGPRWLVRSDWVPPAYDYHPLLREDEEGGNLPIGFSQATGAPDSTATGVKPSKGRDKSRKVFDCAICMQDLEVPVAGLDGSLEGGLVGASSLLLRRGYMVTPCRHIFHSHCLEGWMKYRLQCPICREDLPPL